MAKIKVKLVKSIIGRADDQIATVKALGLKKIGSEVVQEDTPQIKGMVQKVAHLVEVTEM